MIGGSENHLQSHDPYMEKNTVLMHFTSTLVIGAIVEFHKKAFFLETLRYRPKG